MVTIAKLTVLFFNITIMGVVTIISIISALVLGMLVMRLSALTLFIGSLGIVTFFLFLGFLGTWLRVQEFCLKYLSGKGIDMTHFRGV